MTNSTYNSGECLGCTHCAQLLEHYETLRSQQAIVSRKLSSSFTTELAVEAGEIAARRNEARDAWMRHRTVHRTRVQVQGRSE